MLNTAKINKLAIIAGNGNLPAKVIASAENLNINFIIVGIKGLSNKRFINKHTNHLWIKMGEVSKTIKFLKELEISHICFVGSIKRPSIFAISFDDLGKVLLKRYLQNISGDNSLLSLLITVLEEYNFSVIAAQTISPNILSFTGNYSNLQPTVASWQDIIFGFNMAKKIGELDIGQSVIVQQNMVIAVEGVEGTKALINRSKKLLKKQGNRGILVKVKKPNQEERVDLPTIGSKTLIQAKKAGLLGIVIEAGSTIILDSEKITKLANKYNMFVVAVNEQIIQQKQLELINGSTSE